MQPIRIFFEKTDTARFISHLDLVRSFGRSLRRAGIPFWYTEGFNPHPFMTFASPLSLGTVGLNESVDIKLTADMPCDEIVKRLNRALPNNLRATKAAAPVHKPTELAYSRYELCFTHENGDALAATLADFFAQDAITAQKKNKKKQLVDVDIKSALRDVEINKTETGVLVTLLLPSGCTENLNPALVLDALKNFTQEDIECLITRVTLLCADMSEFE